MTNRNMIMAALAALMLLFAVPAGAQMMGGYGYGHGPGMMYGQGQGQGYGQGYGRGYGYGPGMMYGYGDDNPKARQQAAEIEQKYAEKIYPLQQQYYDLSRKLSLELAQDKPDESKVRSLNKQLQDLSNKIADANMELRLELSKKGLAGGGNGGYGYGRGMGPGMMYGPGYGPGMMGHGWGMGPGMMYGPGYGY